MPRISAFYGIVIYMYRREHPPPHFHAEYGEYAAKIELKGLRPIAGHLPARQLRLVQRWASLHRRELLQNWEKRERNEPLSTIEPLR